MTTTTTTNAYTQLVNRLGELYSASCEQYRTSEACRELCDSLQELLIRVAKDPEYQEPAEGECAVVSLSTVPNVACGCWLHEYDHVCGDGMAVYYVDGGDYTELLLCESGDDDGLTMRLATALVVGRKVYTPDMGDTDSAVDVQAMMAEYQASIA